MAPINDLAHLVLIGAGATLVMDVWVMLLKRMGVQTLNFAFVGRWVGHVFRGKFFHAAIREATPVPRELMLGWITHYAIGVLFAGLLIGLCGREWAAQPTLFPALLVGVGTVVAPLLVMQPAMGSGIASSKTPTPFKNCFRSVINHAVFGLGLYLSATLVAALSQ